MSQSLLIFLFFFQIVLIYLLSRWVINKLFHFLRIFISDDHLVFSLVSLLFFPGTIVHEVAHFFAATVLFLRVRSISIFPKWEGREIKLGSVLYEKKDFVRGLLVGIAPIFAGLLFFWFVAVFNLFPSKSIVLNIVFLYLIFAVSSMMFSSKRDLVDLIYIFPFLVFLYGFIYIFDLKLDYLIRNEALRETILNFIKQVNIYLLISITINVLLLIIFLLLKKLIKRKTSAL
ncbi:hypothetical protein HY612_01285 [Candidatus Roizmanbacteria bacterium]|nr:hypothetical protein [Candidatus Roizmanbacteria bacterium]